MTDIRTTDFCDQYGYTQAQITYAIKTGKLKPLRRGVIDEELALQALNKVKPARAKTRSDQESIILDLQNEIQKLKAELQNSLELNLRYQAELNQQVQSESKLKFSGEQLQQNQEQLTRHPFCHSNGSKTRSFHSQILNQQISLTRCKSLLNV